jgi:hypothetical protein
LQPGTFVYEAFFPSLRQKITVEHLDLTISSLEHYLAILQKRSALLHQEMVCSGAMLKPNTPLADEYITVVIRKHHCETRLVETIARRDALQIRSTRMNLAKAQNRSEVWTSASPFQSRVVQDAHVPYGTTQSCTQ